MLGFDKRGGTGELRVDGIQASYHEDTRQYTRLCGDVYGPFGTVMAGGGVCTCCR